MRFVYPEINNVFDTDIDFINTVVIENQNLFYKIIEDINNQINGIDGKSVLSVDNSILPISKNLEILSQFIPFEINRKSILTKICSVLEARALNDENGYKTSEMLSSIEKYLFELSFDLSCDLNFEKISIASIIKASGMELADDYNSLGEKIIDLIELITEFDKQKLFVTINLRSYLSDEETEMFMDTVLRHQYNVIMFESGEHTLLSKECRYLVDKNLCEIR